MGSWLSAHARDLQYLLFCGSVIVACAVSAMLVSRWMRPVSGAVRWFDRVAADARRRVTVPALLSLMVSVAVWAIAGTPVPFVHDEFSYLLAGETLASGRLTNPAHPMWVHFESMHVLHQPTYMSKFPPAQSLTLAVGIWLGGAFIGPWLSTAGACAAVSWALAGWVRARWALAGGLLTALHPQVILWSQNYWGGSVALLGGALVVGALPRLLKAPKRFDAVWLGLGAGVLAMTRPYEGLALCVGVGSVLIWQQARARSMRDFLRLTVVGGLLGLAIPAAALLRYNHAVTGDALLLPYTLHTRTYMAAPLFLWSAQPPTPVYRHDLIRRHHTEFEIDWFSRYQSVRGAFGELAGRIWMGIKHFPLRSAPMAVGLVMICLLPARWSPRARLAALAGAPIVLALLISPWFLPHYAAPLLALMIAASVGGLQRFERHATSRRARAFLVLLLLSSVIGAPAAAWRQRQHNLADAWWNDRAALIQTLHDTSGRHVVLVRYPPDHDTNEEWVYNAADIDASRVVWAREMKPAADAELLEYYHDRIAWALRFTPNPTLTRIDRPAR